MPRTVNGIGTKYFGKSEPQPDGSFITTEWFVVFDVPLIPLKSQRVTYLGNNQSWHNTTNLYNILGPAPLDKKLVLTAYAWLFIPLIIGLIFFAVSMAQAQSGSQSPTICAGMLVIGLIFWMFVFPSKYRPR